MDCKNLLYTPMKTCENLVYLQWLHCNVLISAALVNVARLTDAFCAAFDLKTSFKGTSSLSSNVAAQRATLNALFGQHEISWQKFLWDTRSISHIEIHHADTGWRVLYQTGIGLKRARSGCFSDKIVQMFKSLQKGHFLVRGRYDHRQQICCGRQAKLPLRGPYWSLDKFKMATI